MEDNSKNRSLFEMEQQQLLLPSTGMVVVDSSSSHNSTVLPFLDSTLIDPWSFSAADKIVANSTAATTTDNKLATHYELIWTPEVVFRVTSIIVVMVLTLIGNSILIALILCHRKLRKKRVNIFLVNLAMGDLMVCLVTMTTEIVFVAFGEWVLGAAGCKMTVYGQIVTLASATFLLTAMSVDRYQVIVRPLQSLTGQPSICRKVVCAWLCAFLFAAPQLFIFVQTEHKDEGGTKHLCRSQGYTAPWQRKVYFTFLTAYILVLPTAVMTFCYVNIVRVVFMRTGREQEVTPKLRFTSSKKQPQNHEHQQQQNQASYTTTTRKSSSESQNEIEYSLSNGGALPHRWNRRRSAHPTIAVNSSRLNIPNKLVSASKRKVVKMTLSVIVAFLFCWTPYFVVGLIRIYSGYRIRLDRLYSVAEILAMLHSALNPILYGIFSTQSAAKVLRNCICCRRRKKNSRGGGGICDTSLGGSDYYDESVLLGTTNAGALMKQQQSLSEESNLDKTCGCIRFLDKVCSYCSSGYKASQASSATTARNIDNCKDVSKKRSKKTFYQHQPTTTTTTSSTGNCRGITVTDGTFVELSRIDSLAAVNEVRQARRDGEDRSGRNLIYNRTFPYRVDALQQQQHGNEVRTCERTDTPLS